MANNNTNEGGGWGGKRAGSGRPQIPAVRKELGNLWEISTDYTRALLEAIDADEMEPSAAVVVSALLGEALRGYLVKTDRGDIVDLVDSRSDNSGD